MSTLNILDKPRTQRGKMLDKLSAFIGGTPLFPISNLIENPKVSVFGKLEWQQFGGSVKSRPAFRIIKDAFERSDLSGEKHILDASSGNSCI
ncbi:MAG: pyridoxal-phosphate dependent enzyme, partial [Balneolaceae bacterium]